LLVGQSPFFFLGHVYDTEGCRGFLSKPWRLGLLVCNLHIVLLDFVIIATMVNWEQCFSSEFFWEPILLSLVGRHRYNGDFSQEELAKSG